MLATFFAMILFCAPTTTSTTQSSEADLRRIIDGLRKQVADLKSENAQLTRDLRIATTQLSKQAKADQKPATGKLAAGMTMEEVERVLRNKGILRSETGSTKVYLFQVAGRDAAQAFETGWQNTDTNALVTATFSDDKLLSYSIRSEH